ncbi:hypothetical protein [Pseudoflavitalea rhizosphaerae]|uniref:hypothetical protein n=1 Tax=Pseudoflavitalea rhizosphaerae TaxID=1884793 RepID=UPI000F8C9A10|nr:hypothetical protein [Pseudoflavitalea rhizosphaerae]
MNKYFLSLHRAISLLLISVSVLLFSCQKETNDPPPEEQEPSDEYLITEMDNNYGRYKLTYNEKDQLTVAEFLENTNDSPDPRPYQKVEYKYENGKVTGFSQWFYNTSTKTWGSQSEAGFVYDQNGRVSKMNGLSSTTTYEYDVEGRPIKISPSNYRALEFSYNADGNVVYAFITSDYPGYPYRYWSDMKYTSHKNLLLRNGTAFLLYTAFGIMTGRPTEVFSAHLPEKYETLSVRIPPAPVSESNIFKGTNLSEYSYIFDNDGLLKSITEKYKNQTFYGNTLDSDNSDEAHYEIIAIKR